MNNGLRNYTYTVEKRTARAFIKFYDGVWTCNMHPIRTYCIMINFICLLLDGFYVTRIVVMKNRNNVSQRNGISQIKMHNIWIAK